MSTMLYQEITKQSRSIGENNDCSVRAMCVATGESYEDCHAAFELAGRKRGDATWTSMYSPAADLLGYNLIKHDRTNTYYTDCRYDWINHCKTPISAEKHLPREGGYILIVDGHAIGARDGSVHDWTRGRRHRILSIFKLRKKCNK